MALIEHRIVLDNPTFPLLSEFQGRTIMVRGSGELAYNQESSIPQVYYAHNVLPTPYGYQSIGFSEFIAPSTVGGFIGVVTLREASSESTALLGITSTGRLLISTLAVPAWTELGLGGIGNIRNRPITVAYVQGVTYIYFYRLGCFVYDFTHKALVPVTLVGLDPTKINGIVGSQGYLVAFGVGNAVAWSNPILATDFVPSLVTGAGAGIIEGAQGETVAAITVQSGIIFLNASNATAAIYQANGRFPFFFEVIVGCGGLSDPNFASYTVLDSPAAYAYTTSGLQAINIKQAEAILPQVTEFLSGRRLEDFNGETNKFTITTPSNVIKKRLAWIADRYLVISYGDELLTHALVYDTFLGRLGKIRLDHVAIFEFTLFDQTIFETPKKSIGILKADGSIVVVDTDIATTQQFGVMILGKYQYVRERRLMLQSVTLENIHARNNFTLQVLSSQDGKTLDTAVTGYRTGNTGLSQDYLFSQEGKNHSILCKGRFNLVSGIIQFSPSGRL